MNTQSEKDGKTFFTFRKLLILVVILTVAYILLFNYLGYDSSLKVLFSDISPLIIEISVLCIILYAVKHSKDQGRRVQLAWMFIALSVLIYFMGDLLWAILEIGYNQLPFPSAADIFYLAFYPVFVLAIYYLPRVRLSKNYDIKFFMDMAIITLSISLFLLSFLILPNIYTSSDLLASIISIAYIIGDIILIAALFRIIFFSFAGIHPGPLVLLGMGILVQVISDSIYSFQSIHGTYVSGSILDVGWTVSIILIGLAALLQIKPGKGYPFSNRLKSVFKKTNFSIYIPFVVLLTYAALVWANANLLIPNFLLVEISGGIIIFLILLRQYLTVIENRDLYRAAKAEIAHRKNIEYNLLQSRKEFKSIFENSPIGIFHSTPEGKFLLVNNALAQMLYYDSTEELIEIINKTSIKDIYVDKDKRKRIIDKAMLESAWQFYENEFYRQDGSVMIGELSFRAVNVDENNPTQYLEGFIKDITEQRKTDNAIKESLREKELLLKEIHHRVKNNLQIISGLLDLQKHYVEHEETINILNLSQNRVKSMATIHEMLYQSTDLTHINFSDYIYYLISDIFHSYQVKPNIKPIIEVDEISLNIETAIPCGLIINELVSNSIKYAFPEGKAGSVNIELHDDQGDYELIVSDNGVGFTEEIEFTDLKKSLGLKLVQILVEQIDGHLELDRSQGTSFKIKFKELQYKKRF